MLRPVRQPLHFSLRARAEPRSHVVATKAAMMTGAMAARGVSPTATA